MVSDLNPEEKFTIKSKHLSEHNESLPQLRNLNDDVDDLTNLSHLNEASVLNATKIRYTRKEIYTYSGIVLVAINPFDSVEYLYGVDKIIQYQNKSKFDNPPHLFSIANDAYNIMKQNGESQSIIVSGESGAGKTVSAKYIMRFFANVDSTTASPRTIEIEKQILATNPIMEAFGNAKTTRNDNSSRFGKYLQIQFDSKYSICGANIKTYLLERSRLVYQQNLERNYHIFYQMIKGLPSDIKSKLSIKSASDYNYLYQGGTSLINGVDDAKEFKETCEALELIGIDHDTQFEIFKILASLLHIGNIKIEKSRDIAIIDFNDPNLMLACEFLGLDPSEFGKWIVKKKISTRSDNIISNLKYHEAIVSRDSIAKYIYSSLFNWLCDSINEDLSTPNPTDVKSFIGVLDIYGFEHFEENSFEQFCINYANEKLQQEFTQHVFKLQQEEYKDEGIEWSFIEFSDNQPCIDLIESRAGILSLLDEQCRLPSGSEQAWSEKMFHSLVQPPFNKVFKKARFGNEKFVVSHYALDVEYTVNGFLEKNRDTVPDVQSETLKSSSNQFLLDILNVSHETSVERRPNGGIIRKNKKPTLGSIFKSSLIDLMKTINSTDVNYIRCIKPNDTKTSWEFDNLMVLSQLRACGVLETIKISMVGFQSKCTFTEFLKRFIILLPDSDNKHAFSKGKIKPIEIEKQLTSELLDKFINKNELYQMGKTKIFFKSGVISELEIFKTDKVRESAILIQKYLKGVDTRVKFKKLKLESIKLQSFFRGYLSRNEYHKKKVSLLKIQAVWRGVATRMRISNSIASLDDLKAIIKGNETRNVVHEQQIENARLEVEARHTAEKEKTQRELAAQRELQESETKRKIEETRLEHIESIPSPTKSNKDNAKMRELKKSHRKGILTFDNFSQDSLDEISKLAPIELGTAQSSAEEFSRKNTDTSLSDDSPLVVLSKSEAPLTEKELEFFRNSKPKDALEISIINLLTKMDKISNLVAESEVNFDGNSNIKLKSDFERDIFIYKVALERVEYDDHDRGFDKPKNQRRFSQISKRSSLISSFSGLQFNEEESHRNYKVSLLDIKSYMKGPPMMPEMLGALLLKDLTPPGEESVDITIKDILLPSRSITEALKSMWKLRMDGQSVIFLKNVVEIFKTYTKDKSIPDDIISFGVYLMNNLNDISKFLSDTRENLMYDLFSTKFGDSKRRSELMRLLLIMKRYFDAFFGVAYNEWMKVIIIEIEKRSIDAIVLDNTMISQQEKNPNVYFREMFGKGPKYKMFDLVRVFSNVFLAMKVYFVDKKILDSVVADMLRFIDSLIFNDLISRDKFLTYEIGVQIKYNLSLLIDWCHEHQIPNSPDALIHILTLCQILMLKKQGMAESEAISKICECMSVKQVERILNGCLILEGETNGEEIKRDSQFNIPLNRSSFENAFIVQR